MGIKLLSPLEVGSKYYASFKVSLAGSANRHNWCGVNKIGALFTTHQFSSSLQDGSCNNCAQIFSDAVVIDTLKWIKIIGSFIADSVYSFIQIGRFNPNSLTDSIQLIGSGCNAYYFIDDVCVTTDSLYNETWASIGKDVMQSHPLVCYPNPATDVLHIKSVVLIILLELINYLGQSVLVSESLNSNNLAIRVNHLAKGSYILKATSNNQTHFQKILLH